MKIVLGSNGVKELPRLKTQTSLIIPVRYTLKDLEVYSVNAARAAEVSLGSVRELQMTNLTIRNAKVNITVEPFFGSNLQSLTMTGCEFPNRKMFDLMSMLPREEKLEGEEGSNLTLPKLVIDDTAMLS